MFLRLLLALTCLWLPIAWAAPPLEVVPLRHRLAEDIAPLIRPLLAPGDVLVPHGTHLILQAEPDRMAHIKALLQTLDKQPHRLRIVVRQGGSLASDERGAGVNVRGRVDVTRPGRSEVDVGGRLYRTDSEEDRRAEQVVQTLEGTEAQIRVGESRPVPFPAFDAYGRPFGGVYQQLDTGFAVVARLAEDGTVFLDVYPWSGRADPTDRRVVRGQSAHTSVQARLGEWVAIGGSDSEQSLEQSRLLGYRHETRSESTRILIKVEDLDAGTP